MTDPVLKYPNYFVEHPEEYHYKKAVFDGNVPREIQENVVILVCDDQEAVVTSRDRTHGRVVIEVFIHRGGASNCIPSGVFVYDHCEITPIPFYKNTPCTSSIIVVQNGYSQFVGRDCVVVEEY
ncbi:MAG: hypothetical protein UT34_C0002G0082 [candidate division WS6 bacterium GW2011_GWF2_39_15]|uniref:Uncharacterized protein n=1 Tax=candidate division WS6 bacterium GW2011_GWF2_39_15 TaxID=1619100 RepID=A0A0G0Q587_9BACT|nr:MAG: hypothetical protein UT34_C0002G0082 [candidate division WS6 bacterium GW2011_GWF2_39_15]